MSSRFNLLSIVVLASLLNACASVKNIEAVEELPTNERVLVGRVVLEGVTVQKLTPGIFLDADIRVSHKPESTVGDMLFTWDGGEGDAIPKTGLVHGEAFLHFAAKRDTLFFRGIRTRGNAVLVNLVRTIPLGLAVKENDAPCQYIGTIVVKAAGEEKLDVQVRDRLADEKAELEGQVKGCKLVKNLATKATKNGTRTSASQSIK